MIQHPMGGQKITPHLWFDTQAREAARMYTSLFNVSSITSESSLQNTPSGSVDLVEILLWGQRFTLISAGPLFKFSPAISFLVACSTKEEVDRLWQGLSVQGSVLMELGEYPFSERYGWVADRYGLSWQVMFMGDRPIPQRIIPTLMYVGDVAGKAEEAITLYTSLFHHAKIGEILRYGKDEAPDREGTVKHASFELEGQSFAAMDSAQSHEFTFTEAISLMVNCETQKEIDHYWKLSAVPKAVQCGWLKDKYGVSWQVHPVILDTMLQDKNPKKVAAVTEAFLKMKKFDIASLKKAYAEG